MVKKSARKCEPCHKFHLTENKKKSEIAQLYQSWPLLSARSKNNYQWAEGKFSNWSRLDSRLVKSSPRLGLHLTSLCKSSHVLTSNNTWNRTWSVLILMYQRWFSLEKYWSTLKTCSGLLNIQKNSTNMSLSSCWNMF